ncbi:MAG: metallophosphoesterase [Pleurocapsa minor GSE-CHR-MK-17-07R]|nr:metallophosphoesterase [Pleurocapsa minor GSE-CHR-MK 17-07R]
MNVKTTIGLLAGAALGGAALAYARFIEPFRWDVTRHEIRLSRLPAAFDGYTIVHLSDLHMDDVTNEARLMEVVALANAEKPDIVVLTGDFVTADKPFDGAALTRVLAALEAPDGKLGVLGNHDRLGHVQAVIGAVEAGGVTVLNNAVHTLYRGPRGGRKKSASAAALTFAGVDSLYRRRPRLDEVLNALPAGDGVHILLAHEPDFADVAAPTRRFAFQLSGHAHGGQVRVPFLTSFGLPRYGMRYVEGLNMVGDMLLYAHRGLGMTSAPIRFNCRPEIAVHVLRAHG